MNALGCPVCLTLESRPLSPGSRVRVCAYCAQRYARCAFCSFTTHTGEHLRAWRYFAIFREEPPTTFPADYRIIHHETCEWICCPACFAESGEAAMMKYINNWRTSMLPEPTCTRITWQGELVEERTS